MGKEKKPLAPGDQMRKAMKKKEAAKNKKQRDERKEKSYQQDPASLTHEIDRLKRQAQHTEAGGSSKKAEKKIEALEEVRAEAERRRAAAAAELGPPGRARWPTPARRRRAT